MCPDMCKGMCLYAYRGQEKALGSWVWSHRHLWDALLVMCVLGSALCSL